MDAQCFVVRIFLKNLCISDVFLSNRFLSYYFMLQKFSFIFIMFMHALDSLKISSILNSRLPGPRWRARSHIVLEYNNENMRFIRLLLANQIAYIFRSNDKLIYKNKSASIFQRFQK